MTKLTIPQRAFLGRVERGEIKVIAGYTARRGGYERYIGGFKTIAAMERARLIVLPAASIGRPGVAYLTDAGRAALAGQVQP